MRFSVIGCVMAFIGVMLAPHWRLPHSVLVCQMSTPVASAEIESPADTDCAYMGLFVATSSIVMYALGPQRVNVMKFMPLRHEL